MKKITITIPTEQTITYPIFIGKNLVQNIEQLVSLTKYEKIFIITDTILEKLNVNQLLAHLPNTTQSIIVPSGEKVKSIDTIQYIWSKLLEFNADRTSLIINIGGGVITDMGGFAASTFMRGIDFINIPTTLLSQVDASVGGKTGFNFGGIKNSIGTFNQPSAVIIDVATLQTLPKRELLSGFAEIIKHGLIKNLAYFTRATAKSPEAYSQDELITIIEQSCSIKADIIAHDTYEKGERKLLNFGHTIGHAIEAASLATSQPLLHGEAIAVGMVAEAKLSRVKGFLSDADVQLITTALKQAELPTQMPRIATNIIIEKLRHDKKATHGIIQWTLLKKIGDAIIDQQVEEQDIIQVLDDIRQ